MLNRQMKKVTHQTHAMRQRGRSYERLARQRNALLHQHGEQVRSVRALQTSEVSSDGVYLDMRNWTYLRESRRLRALQGRLVHIEQKMARIKAMGM